MLILIVGGALVLSGLMTLHQVWGANAQAIPEWQLIQAVTRGGVHRADPAPLGQDGQATQPAGGGGVQKVQNPPDYCPT